MRRPPELATSDWQTALRRQFGREQRFGLTNLGSEPVFSDFRVDNPASGGSYRVAIRGSALGQNFCSCPDFATNDLGTCKHVEFTLARRQAALRHGVDELIDVLDELLADPAAKAVVFSQWLVTHELIERLPGTDEGQRDWGYVLFIGSVPREKRGASRVACRW